MSASDKTAVDFILSEGQCHDAPHGRLLMDRAGKLKKHIPLVMDRAYEDDYTRYLAQTLHFIPTVPPKKNRKNPWDYDKELYRKRNQIERLFRRLINYRRVFCRYEKLDVMFAGFVQLALIFMTI